ncbi:MAG: GxxExxY protein [Verrucomicrobia bacterium]|nr:GxxExxY protein [Verrucomicrobiota bacterium]
MDANNLLFKDEVYAIVGCAIEVLKGVGHGFHEKPYENAMVVEFGEKEIPHEQQKRFELNYKNKVVGEFIPDLIAYGKVIIDTKVIDSITTHERGQMINYLKITNLQVGIIINFKRPKLEWERIVHSKNYSRHFESICD